MKKGFIVKSYKVAYQNHFNVFLSKHEFVKSYLFSGNLSQAID